MTLLSYSSGGSITGVSTIRENLGDYITVMSRNETPLMFLLSVESTDTEYYEWMMDEIETPTTTTAKREGDLDPLVDDTGPRIRIGNGIYHDHVSVTVSDQYRRYNEAGTGDEYNLQLVRTGLKFAKRQETNLRWQTYTQGSAGAAPQTAGLIQWAATTGQGRNVTTNPTIAGRTFSWTYGSRWLHQANGTALTEATFRQTCRDAHIAGLNLNNVIFMVGAAAKERISDFAVVYGDSSANTQPLQQYTASIESRMKMISIDRYVGDFGTIHFALDHFGDQTSNINITEPGTARTFNVRANNTIFGLDPQFVKRRVLVPFKHQPLAKNHLVERGALTISQGFQVDNPIAMLGISNVDGTQPSIA